MESPYLVHLLYNQPQQIDPDDVLESLRDEEGHPVALGPRDLGAGLLLAHRKDTLTTRDGMTLSPVSLIRLLEGPLPHETVAPSLEQTWDWPEARAVVESHQAAVGIVQSLDGWLASGARLALFHRVLLAVLEVAPCAAIHWQPSQRVISPEAYRARRGTGDLVFPAINARMFRVEGGAPGELVMDTAGLNPLGLPDLQCHFVGLNPSAVAAMLLNTGYYILEHGDIIDDGHTVAGIGPDQKWFCRHEDALVPPKREVIDINPGPPWVAGQRRHKR